jgi:hypothetical protein
MTILCDRQTKNYYFPAIECCANCQKQFKQDQAGVIRIVSRLGTAIYCEKCIKKVRKASDLAGYQFAGIATYNLTKNSIVVNEKKLELSTVAHSQSTFEIDLEGKNIDNTKYAKQGGMKMDSPTRKPLEEVDLDKNKISDKEVEEILKGSKPVPKDFNLLDQIIPKTIEHKKQKQIGGG